VNARWIGGLLGLSIAAFGLWASRQPLINDVTTGQTPEYPHLQPHSYAQRPHAVFQAVQALAASMSGWRITVSDPQQHLLHAEARVPLTPFTDDVTVQVETVETGSRVVMRSHSRVGRGDLGVNARRIRAFLRALDLKLGVPHRNVRAESNP
jgi:uncharacterized protein (DUF1499 family)